jgi:hypothetical protein
MATQVEKVSLPQIPKQLVEILRIGWLICRRIIPDRVPCIGCFGRRLAGSPSAVQLVIKHDDSPQVPTRIKVGITAIYFIKPVGSRD